MTISVDFSGLSNVDPYVLADFTHIVSLGGSDFQISSGSLRTTYSGSTTFDAIARYDGTAATTGVVSLDFTMLHDSASASGPIAVGLLNASGDGYMLLVNYDLVMIKQYIGGVAQAGSAGGSETSTTFAVGATLGIDFDLDAGTATAYINGGAHGTNATSLTLTGMAASVILSAGDSLSNGITSLDITGEAAAATPTVTDVDAMAHGSSSNVTVSNFAAAATTGNSTLTSGTVVLTPSSVAGSVLTFPISRLDLQEGSYTWTLDIAGETASTGSVAYTIDGNASDEFYGTVSTLTGVWADAAYSALEVGDNIYAIRTAGTGTPDVTVGAFPADTTWTIYIQDVNDNVWGSSGTLTIPAAPSPSFLPSFARFNNQLIGGM